MFGEPGADRGRISGGFEGLRYDCRARIHHGAGDARRGAERADVVRSGVHPDGRRTAPSGRLAGKQTVGLNVSPLILDHTKDKNTALNAFVALVRHILRTSENAVALIPHVTWAHDNDVDALSAIKAQFADEPRVFLLPDCLNAMQYKGYVKRLSGLVAARTHVSIAAYSTFVPTLVIGYSVKARGIARDLFGEEAWHLLPAQELSGEAELIAAYDALMKRGDAEREQLQRRMPSYMAGQEETLDAVLNLAKGK